jgi:transposase
MPTPIAVEITLSDEERSVLQAWTRRRTTAQALALRARIVLAAADQLTNAEIADLEGVSRPTVTKWRNRFAAKRLEGLLDEPRPGRPRTVTDEQVERVVITTLESKPNNATHWSTRTMAKEAGVSADAVMRIWHAFGLQPHRQETWKLSQDPQLIEKVHDICGLYLNPPERAVVLCVDEKSQIQALDRTAPTLPMLPGTPERATHDYERNGTSSLYAALNVQSGEVISSLHQRHRAIEFLKFLKTIDHNVPDHLVVHLVLDNASSHKTPTVRRWLARHPRFDPALHPDLQQLDQPRRTLVWRAHDQAPAPRPTPLRSRAQRRHPPLDRHLERKPPPLRVDQDRRADPQLDQTLLRTN